MDELKCKAFVAHTRVPGMKGDLSNQFKEYFYKLSDYALSVARL